MKLNKVRLKKFFYKKLRESVLKGVFFSNNYN